jgi:hypothetical protein
VSALGGRLSFELAPPRIRRLCDGDPLEATRQLNWILTQYSPRVTRRLLDRGVVLVGLSGSALTVALLQGWKALTESSRCPLTPMQWRKAGFVGPRAQILRDAARAARTLHSQEERSERLSARKVLPYAPQRRAAPQERAPVKRPADELPARSSHVWAVSPEEPDMLAWRSDFFHVDETAETMAAADDPEGSGAFASPSRPSHTGGSPGHSGGGFSDRDSTTPDGEDGGEESDDVGDGLGYDGPGDSEPSGEAVRPSSGYAHELGEEPVMTEHARADDDGSNEDEPLADTEVVSDIWGDSTPDAETPASGTGVRSQSGLELAREVAARFEKLHGMVQRAERFLAMM